MFSVKLDGGLGNQLFQLAFLMYISKTSGKSYFIQNLDSPSTVHSREQYFESILKQWKRDYANNLIDSTISENATFKNLDWTSTIGSVK